METKAEPQKRGGFCEGCTLSDIPTEQLFRTTRISVSHDRLDSKGVVTSQCPASANVARKSRAEIA
jgi:hypothetical protein